MTTDRSFTSRCRLVPIAIVAQLAAASCGGGGGGGLSVGGGIDGSGLVIGPIEAFGSIVVNGVAFDIADAAITIDGRPSNEAALRLGMLVTVIGDIDASRVTGVANSVEFADAVEGPVESVNVGGSQITVLSQTVAVNSGTVFDGATLATLAPGDVVEVSGLRDSVETIRATRVERRDVIGDFEIAGVVRDLDSDAETFAIGAQPVDYRDARVKGRLADGVFVEVEGRGPLVDGALFADEVEVEDDPDDPEGLEVEIEAVVTEILSASEFMVSGKRVVRFDGQTKFEDGTSADLAVDVRVEVEGTVAADGAVLAEKIKIEAEDDDEDDEDDQRDGRRGERR